MQALLIKQASVAIRRSIRRFVGCRKDGVEGVALIEFAFIAPILIILMLGVLDFGAAIYRNMQVKNSAQAGAQYAMINGFKASSISSAVVNATNYSKISATPAPTQFCGCPSTTGIATAACNSTCVGGLLAGKYVTASAQGVYNTIFPYPFIPESFTFKAQSTVRIP